MRAFAAVFAREVFERRFAFVVAFGAGFVPLIGSLAYGWRSPDAAEGRVLVALVGATALSAAFAILLGGSVIVGETREKRISFFFSRPIPSSAIWAGKLLAAISITVATALLAFAPGWLSGTRTARSLWGFDATSGNTVLAALALAVVLVLGAHAVVTIARLRSPWVGLDLILAPTLAFLAAIFLRSLLRDTMAGTWEEWDIVRYAAVALSAAALLALVLATLLQVAEGRTDARRAHGAFSATFFGVCAFAVALLGGYSWWCASAKATDILAVVGGVQVAPRGTWLAASGPLSAGRGGGSFVFDSASGRSIRPHTWNLAFSPDGTRAVWGEPRLGFFERKDNRSDLYLADLAAARPVATGLETAMWSTLVFSPSGRRLAVRDGTTLAAYDVSDASSPKQLAAFPLGNGIFGIAFVDEDTLRVFPRVYNAMRTDPAPAALEIREFSLSSKKFLVTGRFDLETLPFLRVAADARTFIGTKRLSDDANPDQVLTLHDGRTGALVTTLADGLRSPQARFLTGGRIAVAGIAGASARLVFYEGEMGWVPARAIDLGPARVAVLGGEITPGRVVVALNPSSAFDTVRGRDWQLCIVDAASGQIETSASGVVPAGRFAWWYSSDLPPAEPGAPWSTLFLDAAGRLVRLDPATGAQTVLLGKGK